MLQSMLLSPINSSLLTRLGLGIVIGLLTITSLPTALAQDRDLHIETFIYGAREKLVSENLTLFTNGRVYDFRRDANNHEVLEVAVYDPQRQRFELFDVVGRRRTSVSEQEILDMLALVVANPDVTKRDPMLFDSVEMDAMEETYDQATGWITLKTRNGRLVYRAHGSAPKNPDALTPYCNFIDWYSRLNVSWGLSPADRKLIEDLGKWVEFPRVESAQYYLPDSNVRR